MRTWKNVEIEKKYHGRLKEVCRDYHIKFETSEVENMIHFEVLVNDAECTILNDFLDTL